MSSAICALGLAVTFLLIPAQPPGGYDPDDEEGKTAAESRKYAKDGAETTPLLYGSTAA